MHDIDPKIEIGNVMMTPEGEIVATLSVTMRQETVLQAVGILLKRDNSYEREEIIDALRELLSQALTGKRA